MASTDIAPTLPTKRPELTGQETAYYTALEVRDLFQMWLTERMNPRLPPPTFFDDEERGLAEISACMMGNDDSFGMARFAEVKLGWKADDSLVSLFDTARAIRRNVLRNLTKRWVVSKGLQTSAQVGDGINFAESTVLGYRTRYANVTVVDTDQACLLVTTEESPPRVVRVPYENVAKVFPKGATPLPPSLLPTPRETLDKIFEGAVSEITRSNVVPFERPEKTI